MSLFWRRWLFLVAGGALFAPYAILALVALPLALLSVAEVGTGAIALLGGLSALVAIGATSLLPVVRALEAAIVPALLGGAAQTLEVLPVDTWRDGVRNGVWYLTHTVIGALASAASVVLPPLALALCATAVQGEAVAAFGPFSVRTTPGLGFALAVGMLAGTAVLVWVAGGVLSWLAPRLLGPSWTTRLAELERRALQLTERNRLARELHDSVGHALTLTTLQAGAARSVLDTDRAFVAQALKAIEETGREAAADLDGLLKLLRERDAAKRPQPTLTDLTSLVEAHQSAGFEAEVDVDGDLAAVPAVISREGFRIVQEGLTNVRRHAKGTASKVRVRVAHDRLRIEVHNPDGGPRPSVTRSGWFRRGRGGDDGGRDRETLGERGDRGGLGLPGMHERVQLLGGVMHVGPTREGDWLLQVELPIAGPR